MMERGLIELSSVCEPEVIVGTSTYVRAFSVDVGPAQVYDTEGRWLRAVGEGFLNSPSAFATDGPNIVVAELFARLAVVGQKIVSWVT
ncbi:MAG TPA: hypothetical protein VME20_11910 [Acidimicrobiales bacterium]|nr:hypothetical protein [Acidimicrobiales bacterium]